MNIRKKETRGERVCRFISEYCVVPEGDLMGQPMVLEPFQRKFILAVFDNPHGTKTAVLSIGRKNGKTALIAALLLAFVVGPEAKRNTQIVSGALSKDQAAIVFKLARKMVDLNPALESRCKVFPSGKQLLGVQSNVEFAALSAEAKTKHGLSPYVIIFDEMGQVKGPTNDFVTALNTAQGAYKDGLKIIISTQAATDNDMLSRIIDNQRERPNPRVVCHVYETPMELPDADGVMVEVPLGDEEAWKLSNPALGVFRSLDDLRDLYKDATELASFEPEFRNLNLNQRVEAKAPFVSRSTWQSNGAEPVRGDRPSVYGGMDLSSVSDLTAAVLVDEENGSVYPYFWLPEQGLRERSKADKVPYNVWHEQGFLLTTPGKAIQYRYVAQELRRIFDKFDVKLFAFDRYLMAFLKEWLRKDDEKTGKPLFSVDEMDKFVEFGQGTAAMTPALRDLEVKLLEAQLRHGNHPVLSMCAGNCKVVGDSGARKFDKKTVRGRIDGMVALAMAVGVMPQEVENEKRTWDDYLADMAVT
ncbi:MAG: terminase large subunit [Novosphingobium sp.]|nr:terminase large subunit [Novosphingobium sp.]